PCSPPSSLFPYTTLFRSIRVGTQIALLGTGSGRTLLAFQDPHLTEEALDRWQRDGKDHDVDAIRAELDASRAAGHRIGPSQQIRGVDDVSGQIGTASCRGTEETAGA